MLELCSYCRVGFTCRCIRSILFGTPTLPGGQAQFIRVPWAGGTLFKVDSIAVPSADGSIPHLTNSSLLLMADILPTGAFAALQALQHVKNAPMLTGVAYPFNGYMPNILSAGKPLPLPLEDRILTFAVIGLGPVGVVSHYDSLQMMRLHILMRMTPSVRPSVSWTCLRISCSQHAFHTEW